MFKYFFLIISCISISFYSYGETIEIEMLNKLEKEKMVYSIKVAKVNIGDTIIWKSVDKGHNVEFVEMPEGVKKFKSKINKDAEYKFEIPGIYLYICTPHKSMGMIGLVVVGDDLSNLDEIKKAYYDLMKKFHPDKDGNNYLSNLISEAKNKLLNQ